LMDAVINVNATQVLTPWIVAYEHL